MKNIHKIGKELFITSDEEIKEGDYMYNTINNTINKCWEVYRWDAEYNNEGVGQLMLDNPKDKKRGWGFLKRSEAKKIILTTDQDLIADGIDEISEDELLEWFVKNPSCIKVDVVYGFFNPMGRQVAPNDLKQNHSKCVWKYKIIIPQEEPKLIKCYCGHTTTKSSTKRFCKVY